MDPDELAVVPNTAGGLELWPTDTTQPEGNNLSYAAVQTVTGAAIVAVGTGGLVARIGRGLSAHASC